MSLRRRRARPPEGRYHAARPRRRSRPEGRGPQYHPSSRLIRLLEAEAVLGRLGYRLARQRQEERAIGSVCV